MNKKITLKFLTFMLTIGFMITLGINSLMAEEAQDYYMEKNIETSIDGKPMGGPAMMKLWVTKDAVRYFNSNDKDTVLIIKMNEDNAYQLNEKEKTVKTVDLKAKFAAIEKEVEVSSKKTEEKKKIGDWDAYKVMVTSSTKGASTEVEYWLSEAVKFPTETRLKMSDYFGQRKIMEELKKYPGYPVELIVHINVQNKKIDMVTRLTKLEEKKVEPQLFEIPSDYKKVDFATTTPKPPEDLKSAPAQGNAPSPAGAPPAPTTTPSVPAPAPAPGTKP